jgi:RNA polymerase sigma-70 factor (ECF subfamily)
LTSVADAHLDLFQQHRPFLYAISYRMLGSAMEADDVLQDVFLRFRSVAVEEIRSPRAYLSTMVTRLSLNQLTSARVRRENYLGPWLPEPVLSADHPELSDPEIQASRYESVSLAFLMLLERLTPAERAVFLLREVFAFPYDEIAEVLEKSPAACRKIFSRARGFIAANRPRFSPSPEEHRRVLEEFMGAVGSGDVSGLMAMLADDVTFWADGGGRVRGAALQPVHGRETVARFVLSVTARFMPQAAQFAVVEVNGQPTLLIRDGAGRPALVVSIEESTRGIRGIWVIANPEKLGAV